MVRLRVVREPMGLSLTDLSERTAGDPAPRTDAGKQAISIVLKYTTQK